MIGALVLLATVVVYACCHVSGRCSRDEEAKSDDERAAELLASLGRPAKAQKEG